jgi:hypothetical protein
MKAHEIFGMGFGTGLIFSGLVLGVVAWFMS